VKKEIIPIDQVGLVAPEMVQLWSDGRNYYTEERTARWAKCTHVRCNECGELCPKCYTHCDVCRGKRELKRYLAREVVEWDGKTAVYSDTQDKYFWSEDELEEYLEDNPDYTVDDLRLILCEPIKLPQVDLDDLFCEYGDEDYGVEIDQKVIDACEALNQAIVDTTPIHWQYGRKRVKWRKGE
jgi:hypothetical protein